MRKIIENLNTWLTKYLSSPFHLVLGFGLSAAGIVCWATATSVWISILANTSSWLPAIPLALAVLAEALTIAMFLLSGRGLFGWYHSDRPMRIKM